VNHTEELFMKSQILLAWDNPLPCSYPLLLWLAKLPQSILYNRHKVFLCITSSSTETNSVTRHGGSKFLWIIQTFNNYMVQKPKTILWYTIHTFFGNMLSRSVLACLQDLSLFSSNWYSLQTLTFIIFWVAPHFACTSFLSPWVTFFVDFCSVCICNITV
jgi:hypothetical protein